MSRLVRRQLPAPLLICVGLALASHVLLLAWVAGSGAGRSSGQGAGPAQAVTARQLPLQPPVRVPDLSAEPAAVREPATPAVVAAASAAASAASQASPEVFDERDYLPRRELSAAPTPYHEVPLLWPAEGVPAGHYAEVLTLFIDETGQVRKVRVDGDGLPPLLKRQAQESFMGARFAPGQQRGQAVKSRIRIEVAFDAEAQVLRKGSAN